MTYQRLPSLSIGALLTSLLIAGCAVGPDFKRPDPPDVKKYAPDMPAQTSSADTTHGVAQSFHFDKDIPADWWALYQSKPLSDLIARGLANNPDLAAAQASLVAAQENVSAAYGLFLPTATLNAGPSYQKISGAVFGRPGTDISPFTLYNANVGVSYGLDIFGKSRRMFEQIDAIATLNQFQLEAAYVTLTANIVTASVQEAALREQVSTTKNMIGVEREIQTLTQKQYEAGALTQIDLLAQRQKLATLTASLPALERQLAQMRHLLATLCGDMPDRAVAQSFNLDDLKLPQEIPLSLPSKLVRQRPDIRVAEAQLHAASAQVGIATANMLPNISLSGAWGGQASDIAQLFTSGANIWNLGANLSQPLFEGGMLYHQREAAKAQLDQSASLYRSTVLSAFRNVADALKALASDADTLKAHHEIYLIATQDFEITKKQFDFGAVGKLDLLRAQQSMNQTKSALIQAKAARLADTAALFQALGGGWWNRKNTISEGGL